MMERTYFPIKFIHVYMCKNKLLPHPELGRFWEPRKTRKKTSEKYFSKFNSRIFFTLPRKPHCEVTSELRGWKWPHLSQLKSNTIRNSLKWLRLIPCTLQHCYYQYRYRNLTGLYFPCYRRNLINYSSVWIVLFSIVSLALVAKVGEASGFKSWPRVNFLIKLCC